MLKPELREFLFCYFADMKTPLTYYGGKQKLVTTILPMFPQHTLYAEPFLGGGALFWAKQPSQVEVINDINRELINLYEVIQNDFIALEKEVKISLHSRDLHHKASVIYSNPDMFDRIKRAWAIVILSQQSFAGLLDGSWGYDVTGGSHVKKIANKREEFSLELAIRLQKVTIECCDALRIIVSRDHPEAFFYCDPPYFNSDMGHYDGYTQEDFIMLLERLSKIEGKFLLSSYPSELLTEYAKKHRWKQKKVEFTVSVARKKEAQKKKVEVLTFNYDLNAA